MSEFSIKSRGYFVTTQNVQQITDRITGIYRNQWNNIVFIKAGDWKKETEEHGGTYDGTTGDYAGLDYTGVHANADPTCCDSCCQSLANCGCADCDGCGECVIF